MSSPAKMLSPLANIWPGLANTINKGLGANGNPPADPTIASPPTPAPPAASPQSPSGATSSAGNLAQTQLSFLTAASKAAAAIGQGATTGKSLLGA